MSQILKTVPLPNIFANASVPPPNIKKGIKKLYYQQMNYQKINFSRISFFANDSILF